MVHWGFHKAWTTNGFGEELCAFVQQRVWSEEAANAGQQQSPKRVLITGWVPGEGCLGAGWSAQAAWGGGWWVMCGHRSWDQHHLPTGKRHAAGSSSHTHSADPDCCPDSLPGSSHPSFNCRHSLGGAMATLCAFSLARLLPPDSIQQAVYTFGAPRTGNHAFAGLYNELVPDTW